MKTSVTVRAASRFIDWKLGAPDTLIMMCTLMMNPKDAECATSGALPTAASNTELEHMRGTK